MIVESSCVKKVQHENVKEVETPRHQRVAEASKRKADSPVAPSTSKKKKRNESGSSDSSIVEIFPTAPAPKYDDSNVDDIVVYTQPSQLDLEEEWEQILKTAEKLPDPPVKSLAEAHQIPPGGRFRITTTLKGMSAGNAPLGKELDLKNMLVATCIDCRHVWQYCHFKDSISDEVRRQRKFEGSVEEEDEDDISQGGAYNYLCSKEENDKLMTRLGEASSSEIEYDVMNCFIDRSFVHICPACKSFNKPDSLIQLVPSFFYQLHFKSAQEADSCLHVLACGVHAVILIRLNLFFIHKY